MVKSPDSDADRIISGTRAEMKFATLWKSGVYKFQQLRDQNYQVTRSGIAVAVAGFSTESLKLHVDPRQQYPLDAVGAEGFVP